MHFSQLRHFLPLSTFPRAQLIELAAAARIEEIADRSTIFEVPDEPLNHTLFLLAGEATAVTHTGIAAIIEAGSASAQYALNDGRFRSVTAFTDVVLAYLPFDLVDLVATWDQLAVIERRSNERDNAFFGRGIPRRWRYSFFPALRGTPAARIEELMQAFVPITVQERQVIAHQNEAADAFYVIDSGATLVSREAPAEEGESIELGQLGEGDCFGDEALGQAPYSVATASMISEGVLMRLYRHDFERLQQASPTSPVSTSTAIDIISNGGHWLDVRQRGEWQNAHLPGAYNLPLHELRLHAHRIDPAGHYVCYCNSGRRAAAAAHILTQMGFTASALHGHYRHIGAG
ncbi:MAG: cyclic nucleotide-binding domain-containing protein [Immundisolibacter sp.]|uniref:cyclic nucleotide-binding domain-containing protein n=1 Tax=Immundisolibacter sp. TaxID=1934948 RepID=UPI003D13AEB0